jgi:branched-chain amino acid transport system permease protein
MLQGALAGLAAGGLYAVLAVCLTLMSRLVRVVNFAQSATGMFGCYVAVFLAVHSGLPEWPATLAGIVLGGALSAVLGWIVSTWLAEADTGTRSAVTVAVLLLLISLAFILFGNKPQRWASACARCRSGRRRRSCWASRPGRCRSASGRRPG